MRKVEAGRTERAEAGGSCGHETVSTGYGGLGNHTQWPGAQGAQSCMMEEAVGVRGQAGKTLAQLLSEYMQDRHPICPFRASRKPGNMEPGDNHSLVDEGHSLSQDIPCSRVLPGPENWTGSWEPCVTQQLHVRPTPRSMFLQNAMGMLIP